MENIINEISYTIESNEDQKIKIVVGQGQIGYSSFKNFDGSYVYGPINNISLGNPNDIKGKILKIGSMVTDVNPHTNLTSIAYLINGTVIHNQDPFKIKVTNDNESIYYTTTIKFI